MTSIIEESKAKLKTCPFIQQSRPFNEGNQNPAPANCLCITRKCMAWQFVKKSVLPGTERWTWGESDTASNQGFCRRLK